MICLSPKYLSVYAHKSVNFTIWLRLESLQHTLTEKGFTNGQKLSGFSHGNLSTQVFNIIKAMTRLFWKLFFFYMQPFKTLMFLFLGMKKNNNREVQEILHHGKQLRTHTSSQLHAGA